MLTSVALFAVPANAQQEVASERFSRNPAVYCGSHFRGKYDNPPIIS
jgi:hypothetical protein